MKPLPALGEGADCKKRQAGDTLLERRQGNCQEALNEAQDSKGYTQPPGALCRQGLAHLSTISVDKVVDWLDTTGAKPVVASVTDKSAKKSPKIIYLKIK
ncbi:hypothetical protein [Zobellella taiwanensis]